MTTGKWSVIVLLLSNLFHYYAFATYAFSAVILAPLFFHTASDNLTKILGLVTFSMTFFLKPLGSIVFGHIGDKRGRKIALTYSLVAITIATTSIGLIPTYVHIGVLSSVFLVICLFVQGLCIGGQYTGAIVYIQEHVKKENAAFACGLVGAIGVFGALLGTGASYVFHHMGSLDGWEWRIPFLLSSAIGVLLYVFMKKMQETPIFIENQSQTQTKDVPLMGVVKDYKRPLCSAIFISSIAISMFYLATVYIPNFYIDQSGTTSFDSLGLVCFTQILCIVFMPLLGFVADKLGRENQLKLTSILLIITPLFIFYYMALFNTFPFFIAGIILFSLYASLYAGAGPAYLSESFPVVGRYSGMGLGITIGEGVFGGITPIACVALEQFFESKIAPAYFIIFLGGISYIGILLSGKIQGAHKEKEALENRISSLRYS